MVAYFNLLQPLRFRQVSIIFRRACLTLRTSSNFILPLATNGPLFSLASIGILLVEGLGLFGRRHSVDIKRFSFDVILGIDIVCFPLLLWPLRDLKMFFMGEWQSCTRPQRK